MADRRSGRATTFVVVGGLLVLLLNAVGLLHPVESLVGFVVRPVAGALHLRDTSSTHRQITELQNQVNDLKGQVAQREEAALQNDALRTQLNFAQRNSFKLTGARIITQDPSNFQQVVTIDKGSSAGIGKGMVAVSGGLLVGRIIETTPNSAKVYLVTDYNSAVPVVDQPTRAGGIVRGTRGFGLALEMVQQTDQLKTGDPLITSGFGGDFPAGLILGTVGDIKRRDTDVFQTATVTPGVDFRKLENLFIITGNA